MNKKIVVRACATVSLALLASAVAEARVTRIVIDAADASAVLF